MTIKKINIPYELDLIKSKSWQELDDRNYFITRFHLYIEDYQAESTTYPGEILGSFRTYDKFEVVQAIEKEHSVINLDETICSVAVDHEQIAQIDSKLMANLDTLVSQVSSEVTAQIQEHFKTTVSLSRKQSTSVSQRVNERFEVNQTITDSGTENYHAVACYQPRQSDVYLHYIDYLIVNYSTSFFGLRKKKTNLPRPIHNTHLNRIKINQPLFSLKYYRLLPKSSLIYTDTQYQAVENKVKKPETLSVTPLTNPINLPMPARPERPTLYTLSNLAFPLRWIEREGDWTIEELKQLELNDAEGTMWWFQHGPGRKPEHAS